MKYEITKNNWEGIVESDGVEIWTFNSWIAFLVAYVGSYLILFALALCILS